MGLEALLYSSWSWEYLSLVVIESMGLEALSISFLTLGVCISMRDSRVFGTGSSILYPLILKVCISIRNSRVYGSESSALYLLVLGVCTSFGHSRACEAESPVLFFPKLGLCTFIRGSTFFGAGNPILYPLILRVCTSIRNSREWTVSWSFQFPIKHTSYFTQYHTIKYWLL